MQSKFASKGDGRKKLGDSDKECYNCHKKGHMVKDCWSKGGGKEGQGPKSRQRGKGGPGNRNRTNQATNDINGSLSDVAYMTNTLTISAYDWLLDSATTSHICNDWSAFVDYIKLKKATVQGLGEVPAQAKGHGTIVLEFVVEQKTVQH
jgi:hypothetical protein